MTENQWLHEYRIVIDTFEILFGNVTDNFMKCLNWNVGRQAFHNKRDLLKCLAILVKLYLAKYSENLIAVDINTCDMRK